MNKPNQAEIPAAVPEIAAGSPGTILRRCREFHGITLEEASESTKIGISHLKALEDDQVREFANQAYLKGFLRIYATFLGLNSDDIARMYDKLFGAKAEKVQQIPKTKPTNAPKEHSVHLKKLVLPALLLAAILITATFFKRPPPPLVRKTAPAVVVAPMLQNAAIQMIASSVKKQKPAMDIQPPKEDANPVEKTMPVNSLSAKPVLDVPKSFVLKIRIVQNGKLTATIDDSAPQHYVLTIGDVFEWKAEKVIALDLSNGEGVEVELNGKPYKLPGSPGEPVYVELVADGLNHKD